VVVDALLRRYALISILGAKLLGLQVMQSHYPKDPSLKELIKDTIAQGPYTLQEGFLFKGNKLYVPAHPLRELLLKEAYGGSLAGHFGLNKTLDILREHFFSPKKGQDVHKIVSRCSIYHKAKSQLHQGLCTPHPVPLRPWKDVSVDFIVALQRTQRDKDSAMVIIDWFSKMANFVTCHKADNASYVAGLYFRGIIRLHGVLKTIMTIRDTKFLSHF